MPIYFSLPGFYLYMATGLFSPVYRANFNAGQWIFPLLVKSNLLIGAVWYKVYFIAGSIATVCFHAITFIFKKTSRMPDPDKIAKIKEGVMEWNRSG